MYVDILFPHFLNTQTTIIKNILISPYSIFPPEIMHTIQIMSIGQRFNLNELNVYIFYCNNKIIEWAIGTPLTNKGKCIWWSSVILAIFFSTISNKFKKSKEKNITNPKVSPNKHIAWIKKPLASLWLTLIVT